MNLVDILPYQNPPQADHAYLDTLLGIFAIAGVLVLFAAGFAQSALSDVAEMHPLHAAVIETTFLLAAMVHVGFVVLRIRRNWRRAKLPRFLVIAAVIDFLFVASLLVGSLMPTTTTP